MRLPLRSNFDQMKIDLYSHQRRPCSIADKSSSRLGRRQICAAKLWAVSFARRVSTSLLIERLVIHRSGVIATATRQRLDPVVIS